MLRKALFNSKRKSIAAKAKDRPRKDENMVTTKLRPARNVESSQLKKKNIVKKKKSDRSSANGDAKKQETGTSQTKPKRRKNREARKPKKERTVKKSVPSDEKGKPTKAPNVKKMSPKLTEKSKESATRTTMASDKGPSNAGRSGWKLREIKFNGHVTYQTMGKEQVFENKPMADGIKKFKANPDKYLAMKYQAGGRKYTYIHRAGTTGYKPKGLDPSGWCTLLLHEYQRLPSFTDNALPTEHRDEYTDHMTHNGVLLHTNGNKPILPGRGMGVGDIPELKIIGDVDPSDIHQGSVGDCWLLSGISSLAEFDGAIKKLFRKTKHLEMRPMDRPNMYTITLWDLSCWKEVDIVVDESLPAMADGSGRLLASKPSEDGELWVCYLEKALAAHCGGWDKITGGQCTHAWSLLTGCKEQYMISKNQHTGKYACYSKFNMKEKKWSNHANSPKDCDNRMWRVPWPEVGGGGDAKMELTEEELFMKMYAWDKENYIVAASTDNAGNCSKKDAGLVANHAYSVIDCFDNVAGTDIDLMKIRNPWGKGEIEDGLFDDDGPGWDQYPQIKKELNPVVADDGIFYVTKDEFFNMFGTIYLSASNMTEFLED